MFKIRYIHSNAIKTAYAVRYDRVDGTFFLLYDKHRREWKWAQADVYELVEEE